MAERRLRSTEKALKRDDTLAKKYNEIIDGYVTKGHARKLTPEGFRLTKWSSSSREVLSQIPSQEMAKDLDELSLERSLGLMWNTETDSFRFSVSSRQSALSKRSVLSQVSSVFDPLGVLAPFLLPHSKFVAQEEGLGRAPGW